MRASDGSEASWKRIDNLRPFGLPIQVATEVAEFPFLSETIACATTWQIPGLADGL